MSVQVFHRCRVHRVDCGHLIHGSRCCWERFPFLFFVHTAPGVQFGFGPASACRSPSGVCSLPRQQRLKYLLIRGRWLTQAGGREGSRMRSELAAAEASMTLQQPEMCRVFSWGSCPWITGSWQWRAAQASRRGGVHSDLCLHTGFLAAAAALAFHARL